VLSRGPHTTAGIAFPVMFGFYGIYEFRWAIAPVVFSKKKNMAFLFAHMNIFKKARSFVLESMNNFYSAGTFYLFIKKII
jgi:hypothetical protein